MQSIYGDPEKFGQYFEEIPNSYSSGDSGYQDDQGNLYVIGRNDDVLKISGHRIGTEEVESAILNHPSIAEAAVVGIPHELTGEAIFAFITLKKGATAHSQLHSELNKIVREAIGPIVKIEIIQWVEALPKTRSGKIMRRILRKLSNNQAEDLGDLSTLSNPEVIEAILSSMSKSF
jgi:acetyl-CoA synthetase